MVWSLQAASSYLGRSWRALQGERQCDHCQDGLHQERGGWVDYQWIPYTKVLPQGLKQGQ